MAAQNPLIKPARPVESARPLPHVCPWCCCQRVLKQQILPGPVPRHSVHGCAVLGGAVLGGALPNCTAHSPPVPGCAALSSVKLGRAFRGMPPFECVTGCCCQAGLTQARPHDVWNHHRRACPQCISAQGCAGCDHSTLCRITFSWATFDCMHPAHLLGHTCAS